MFRIDAVIDAAAIMKQGRDDEQSVIDLPAAGLIFQDRRDQLTEKQYAPGMTMTMNAVSQSGEWGLGTNQGDEGIRVFARFLT